MAARTSRNSRWSAAKLEMYIGSAAVKAGKAALQDAAEYLLSETKKRCPYDPDHDKKHNTKGTHLRDSLHIVYSKSGTYAKITTDLKTDNGLNEGAVVEYSSRVNIPFMQQTADACMATAKEKIRKAIADNLAAGKKG